MRFARDEFSVAAAKRKGRQLPEWYLDEPSIDPVDVFYMKSFYDLGTCRMSAMSIGAIPWTAIVEYAVFYHLEPDVIEAFVDIIREMDQAYVKYQEDAKEKNKPKKPKP